MAKARKKVQKRGKPSAVRKPARSAATKNKSPKQKFAVSHRRAGDFDQGLRPYSAYRDLGFATATGGRLQAHVIRMTKPYDAKEAGSTHYHDVEVQMVYVLKGWFRSEFEGQGPVTMMEGTSWIQPPKIKHTVLGYSDDCELLEIVLPADFDTVTLTK